nr:MAG TPA: hypothetical protein [Caudoviricetes sp.]
MCGNIQMILLVSIFLVLTLDFGISVILQIILVILLQVIYTIKI